MLPTKPGYYWAKYSYEWEVVEVLYRAGSVNTFVVYTVGSETQCMLENFEWSRETLSPPISTPRKFLNSFVKGFVETIFVVVFGFLLYLGLKAIGVFS